MFYDVKSSRFEWESKLLTPPDVYENRAVDIGAYEVVGFRLAKKGETYVNPGTRKPCQAIVDHDGPYDKPVLILGKQPSHSYESSTLCFLTVETVYGKRVNELSAPDGYEFVSSPDISGVALFRVPLTGETYLGVNGGVGVEDGNRPKPWYPRLILEKKSRFGVFDNCVCEGQKPADVYDAGEFVPDGYVAVAFRRPRPEDKFLARSGATVLTTGHVADFKDPRLILEPTGRFGRFSNVTVYGTTPEDIYDSREVIPTGYRAIDFRETKPGDLFLARVGAGYTGKSLDSVLRCALGESYGPRIILERV